MAPAASTYKHTQSPRYWTFEGVFWPKIIFDFEVGDLQKHFAFGDLKEVYAGGVISRDATFSAAYSGMLHYILQPQLFSLQMCAEFPVKSFLTFFAALPRDGAGKNCYYISSELRAS